MCLIPLLQPWLGLLAEECDELDHGCYHYQYVAVYMLQVFSAHVTRGAAVWREIRRRQSRGRGPGTERMLSVLAVADTTLLRRQTLQGNIVVHSAGGLQFWH